MYIDEFELYNPIGAKRGNYKLTAVYFTVENLLKIYKNKDDTIFLCLLARHKYLKLYDRTYHTLFEPLLTDLQTLENGIEYEFGSKKNLNLQQYWRLCREIIYLPILWLDFRHILIRGPSVDFFL